MKLTDKTVAILGGAALALLVITFMMYSTEKKMTTTFAKGTPLVQGISPESAAKIVVKKGSDTVTLVANPQTKGFSVSEKAGYPAELKKVNELLISLFKIRCNAEVTDNAANHADLGVAEDKPDQGSVELIDADGKTLVKVLVGKRVENTRGAHIRLAGKNTVYATDDSPWFYATANNYMETKLVDVSKDKVESVQVNVGEDAYSITQGADKKTKLQPIPEGKKAKDSEVDSVFGALANMNFSDVMKDDGTIKFDAKFVCKQKLTTYFLELAQKDKKHFVRLRAQGPGESVNISKDETKEQLKEKEKILNAADAANTFNKKHAGWVYELSDWKAKNLRKPLKDLVEDIPKKKEGEANVPDKVSASHILIAYKGAANQGATRTKAEAEKLAKSLLKRIKEKKEDFAKLAKEHSACPSKSKGGDLGSFGKGQMAKAFEETSWKLKVGEISDVVEAQFGFHIIKRTK
jgi:hypothetical protein